MERGAEDLRLPAADPPRPPLFSTVQAAAGGRSSTLTPRTEQDLHATQIPYTRIMMKLTTLATLTAATVVRGADHFGSGGCNPEVLEQLGATQAQHPLGGEATYGAAALHTLPLQGDSGPACLDGTPYGFYFQPSTTGSTKWTVSIDGGGW